MFDSDLTSGDSTSRTVVAAAAGDTSFPPDLESFPSERRGALLAPRPAAPAPVVLDRILAFADPQPVDRVVLTEPARPVPNTAHRHSAPRSGALRSRRL